MTTPVSVDEILALLDAVERGDGSAADLDAALGQDPPDGLQWTDAARDRLRDAGRAGLVPAATLLRFGLEPAPQEAPAGTPPAGATVLRPSPSPGRDGPAAAPAAGGEPNGMVAHAGSETVLRPLGSNATPAAAAAPPIASPSTPGTIAPALAAPGMTRQPLTLAPGGSNRGEAVTSAGEVAPGMLLDGRYRLERQLGVGGMGVVFAAADLEMSGETCAVKILKPEIRNDEAARALLRQEVAQARKFPHPNIASVYSMQADPNGTLYIVMEYLEGKPLDALIADDFGRGMPFERAWPLIRDVGQALAFVHSKSVVHSDLKPSNIFVTTSGIPKLLDFGIARISRGRKRGVDGGDFGALTVEYASCEMWDRETHRPEARDDVYSFGCVVYELLSGRHPFDGIDSVTARKAGRRVEPLAGLSAAQNAAIAAALAFDRSDRTPAIEQLLAGLSPVPGKGAAPNARPRGATLPIGIVVTVVLILGLIGWFWYQSSRSPPAGATVEVAAKSNVLSASRAIADEVRALEVDPADPQLVLGLKLMRDAERQIGAGDLAGAAKTANAAETALRTALQSSPRVAHLGSPPDEIDLALTLCKRAGVRCSADDFGDEVASSVVLSPFELDRTEVTNAEFDRFVTEKHYTTGAERSAGVYRVVDGRLLLDPHQNWKGLRTQDLAPGVDPGPYPVRGIDYDTAAAYCAWAGKRLPSGAEWEYVARPDRRIFAWGDDVSRAGGAGGRWVPAADQAATGRFGARGLGGGLWEWTDDRSGTDRALRGSPWSDRDPIHQRLALHVFEAPSRAHADAGIRCSRSVPAWPVSAAAAGSPAQ